MSFLGAKQQAQPEAKPQRQPYRLSGVLPRVMGVDRVALIPLDHEWNRVENDEGKTRQNSHWMSVAGAFSVGPAHSIRKILVAGGVAYNAPIEFGGDDMVPINVGYGDYSIAFRAYRGSDTQTVDPRLNGISGAPIYPVDGSNVVFLNRPAPNLHPNYARICYVVFDVIAAGWGVGSAWEGGAKMPQIEAEVYCLPTIVIGNESVTHGINPIAAIYDILTDPFYGLGLSDDIVPLADWTALAHRFSDERGPTEYLHITLGERSEAQKHLTDILGYIDGFPRIEGGKILVDWFPQDGPIALGDLPEITVHDLVEDALEVDGNDWEETVSEVSVTFADAAQDLGEETLTVNSPYNVQMTGEPKREKFEIAAIHEYWQAVRYGNRKLARLSVPQISGRMRIFRERAIRADGKPLNRGDLFHLDYADHNLDLACRVVEREERGGDVQLRWINEPGQWPELYLPAKDIRNLPFIEPAGAVEVVDLFEVPPPLRGASMWPPRVMPLIQRPGSSVTSVKAWISSTGDFAGEEQELAELTRFAVKGALLASYSDSDTDIEFSTGSGDFDGALSGSFSAAQIANGEMLAYIPATGEVMILGALLDADDGVRKYQMQRGQYWRPAAALTTDDAIWIFPRSMLEDAYQHALITTGTIYFRFQAHALLSEGAITGNHSITLTHQEPMIALDPAPDTDTFFKDEASELVYVHRGMDFPLEVQIEGWIRKVWVSLHYNLGDDENPPEGVENAWQTKTVAYFEYNGNWRDETMDLNLPLDMDVGWNSVMVSVEDIRGPDYITNALGWLWVWDIPAPAYSLNTPERTSREIIITPVTGAARYQVEVARYWWHEDAPNTTLSTMTHLIDAPATTLLLEGLQSWASYNVRVRSASLDGRCGPWSAYQIFVPAPPEEPNQLEGVGTQDNYPSAGWMTGTFDLRMPVGDDAVAIEIHASSEAFNAQSMGTATKYLTLSNFSIVDGSPNRRMVRFTYAAPYGGTVYFAAVAIDRHGNRSDWFIPAGIPWL